MDVGEGTNEANLRPNEAISWAWGGLSPQRSLEHRRVLASRHGRRATQGMRMASRALPGWVGQELSDASGVASLTVSARIRAARRQANFN